MVPAHPSIIVLAGGSGDLGGRIARALLARGANVRALIRPDATYDDRDRLTAYGAEPIVADPFDVAAMAKALRGAHCVVSALNGLRPVIIDRQRALLEAAIAARVPRFIPSDFSADFTRTRPGRNRNFDLRREFKSVLDQAPIKATSILNGAFMDMLGAEMPIIQFAIHRVLYWQNADQRLDFTTKNDTAAFTAEAALDPTTPRILRIAGDSLSAREIATVLTRIERRRYRPQWVGTIALLSTMIAFTKRIAPGEQEVFPPWQG
ncbi:MAG: NmrA family NAD(P)-binding protein, partial [Croceibacterium sp.]